MNEIEAQKLLACGTPTMTVRGLSWDIECTMCNYKKHYDIKPGQSIGNIMDFFIMMYCSQCPKCHRMGSNDKSR